MGISKILFGEEEVYWFNLKKGSYAKILKSAIKDIDIDRSLTEIYPASLYLGCASGYNEQDALYKLIKGCELCLKD